MEVEGLPVKWFPAPQASSLFLAVRVRHEVVRVEVVDVSPVVPIRRTIETDALSGRGIAIVESLASQWGVADLSAQGKTVWFEVAI